MICGLKAAPDGETNPLKKEAAPYCARVMRGFCESKEAHAHNYEAVQDCFSY